VYLNDLEAERLAHCPTLYHSRVYFAALRLQRQDPVPPCKFYKAARVAPVRGRLVLAELVRKGWLDPQRFGPPGTLRTVRYVSTARGGQEISDDRRQEISDDRRQEISDDRRQEISDDRLGKGGKRSQTIASSLFDPDLPSGELVHKTEPSVRTGESAERGANGRTDGSKKFVGTAARLVGSIVDAWDLPKPVVEKCVGRFFDELAGIEPEPTERELSRYFRAALDHREHRRTCPAFSGVPIDAFLGCVCTLVRFSQWREHEARTQLARERELERERQRDRNDDESLTPQELLALLDERAKAASS